MRFVAWSLLLASIWVLLSGEFGPGSLILGLAVGMGVTAFSRSTLARRVELARPGPPLFRPGHVMRGTLAGVRLVLVFAYEVITSNLVLARDVLRPDPGLHPGFVAFDAPDLNLTESVILATLISLTPGSVTVDMNQETSTLYIHSIYAGDEDELKRGFRKFADLILAVRGDGPGRAGSGAV